MNASDVQSARDQIDQELSEHITRLLMSACRCTECKDTLEAIEAMASKHVAYIDQLLIKLRNLQKELP